MASETGTHILAGLAETRRFFGQISQLILTADTLLKEAGWDCSSGSKCTELKSLIGRSQEWMPENIYSFYEIAGGENSETAKNVILFLGVLLDREGAWSGFQEPWFTFGLYQFLPGYRLRGSQIKEWVTGPLDHGHDPDGRFYTWDNPDRDPEKNEGLLHEAFAAVPLISIQSVEDLKHQVIDSLIERAPGQAERTRRCALTPPS